MDEALLVSLATCFPCCANMSSSTHAAHSFVVQLVILVLVLDSFSSMKLPHAHLQDHGARAVAEENAHVPVAPVHPPRQRVRAYHHLLREEGAHA